MNRLIIIFLLVSPSFSINAQTSLPDLFIKTTDGKETKLTDLLLAGKPVVVSFWATWCNLCLEEFESIADSYDEWKEEADFEFVAISIDDSRSTGKVKSLISGKRWPFKVLLDDNQELKRAMNVTEIPFCFIFSKKGKLIYKHTGYNPGDELIIFQELKKATNE